MQLETLLDDIRKESQELERSIEADIANGVENTEDFHDHEDAFLDSMLNYFAECSDVFTDLADLEAELIQRVFKDEPVEIGKRYGYDKFMRRAEQLFIKRKESCDQNLLLADAVSFRKSEETSKEDREKARQAIFEALEELEDD